MSALSEAQFAGINAIAERAQPSQQQGGGGGLAQSLELGIHPETGKFRLQPAGTNHYQLLDHYASQAATKLPKIAAALEL